MEKTIYPARLTKGADRDLGCDTLHCRAITIGYYLNRADQTSHTVSKFCEDCAKQIANNLPAELLEGGADLEQRLRREITAEYDIKLAEIEEAMQKNVRADLEAANAAAAEAAKAIAEAIVTPAEEKPADKPQEVEYRCLDCSETFESKRKLTAHIKTHMAE